MKNGRRAFNIYYFLGERMNRSKTKERSTHTQSIEDDDGESGYDNNNISLVTFFLAGRMSERKEKYFPIP